MMLKLALASTRFLHDAVARSLAAFFMAALLLWPAGTTYAGINQWTNLGPGAGYINVITIDPSNSRIVYVGAGRFVRFGSVARGGSGIFKSTDAGGTWRAAALGLSNPLVGAIAVDPSHSNIVYAGTDLGVSKSIDGAAAWSNTALDDDFILCLAIDPTHTPTVYAGGYGLVYKTTNGGESWTQSPTYFNEEQTPITFFSLTVDASDSNKVSAETNEGIWKSEDGGNTWQGRRRPPDPQAADRTKLGPALADNFAAPVRRRGELPPAEVRARIAASNAESVGLCNGVPALGIGPSYDPNGKCESGSILASARDPKTPTTVYAASFSDACGGVFKSTDDGRTWDFVGLPTDAADGPEIDPHAPSTMYVRMECRGIMKTVDGGITWREANVGLPAAATVQGFYTLALDPVRPTTLYLGAGTAVFKTIDGGQHWADLHPGFGAVKLAVDPLHSDTIYAVSRSLMKSTDGGASWRQLAGELGLGLITVDPTASNVLFAVRSRPPGVFKSSDGGESWVEVANGMDLLASAQAFFYSVAIDPIDPNTILVGLQSATARSRDGGLTWDMRLYSPPTAFSFAFDPTHHERVYAGTAAANARGVLKSEDSGTTWEYFNAGLTSPDVPSVVLHPFNPNVIYGGASGGSVLVYQRSTGCPGDCSGDNRVTVDELVTGVSIALGNASVGGCPAFDATDDARLTVDELVAGVNSALYGCAAPE